MWLSSFHISSIFALLAFHKKGFVGFVGTFIFRDLLEFYFWVLLRLWKKSLGNVTWTVASKTGDGRRKRRLILPAFAAGCPGYAADTTRQILNQIYHQIKPKSMLIIAER